MEVMGYDPVWVFSMSWSLDVQVMYWLNTGDPHPGPVPNGYFTCTDPHVSRHTGDDNDEEEDGVDDNMRRMRKRLRCGGGSGGGAIAPNCLALCCVCVCVFFFNLSLFQGLD